MSAIEQRPTSIVPYPATGATHRRTGGVLAVVGGVLDATVLNLALALAPPCEARIDLILLVEVPMTLPLVAYGHYLLRQGVQAALEGAVETRGEAAGDAAILLCRGAGRALAAEAEARQSTDLVIAAPSGGWWARRRAQRAISYVQRHAACRVFVVHEPPLAAPAARRVAAR